MTCHSIHVQVPGLRLAAKRWGTVGGPPVLALHGWLDNAASFDALAPMLPELDLVALDLPGHGLSDHRAAGEAYHFIDWVTVVFDVARALGWNRFNLLGHSMGAGIAALAAGALPQRFDRLALLEGLGPLSRDEFEAPERVAKYLEFRLCEARVIPRYASLEEAAARLTRKLEDLSLDSALRLVTRGTRVLDAGVTWRSDPRLRYPSTQPFSEARVHAFLNRITAKSLLVSACAGWPFDRAMMQERCGAVRGLQVVQVEGGHHVHLEHPDHVAPPLRALFQLPERASTTSA